MRSAEIYRSIILNHKANNQIISRIRLNAAKITFSIFLVANTILDLIKRNVWATIFFIISIISFLIVVSFFRPVPSNLNSSSAVIVKIPSGTNFQKISDSLSQKGLIDNRTLFRLMGVLSGKDQKIQSGLYKIPHELSTWQILNYLTNGNNITVKVTLPEGISAHKIAGILQETVEIDSAKFMSLVNDSGFAHSLGVKADCLEGYLIPETYYFGWKMPEEEIIKFLVNKTLRLFDADSVQQQLAQLNMPVNKILTLASIIEGEVQVDSERALVSSVYHNRLDRGWLLQADPTIQYILPDGPRRLTYRDLEIDSPYNTYKYPGLPPTPINNPGEKSIFAALYPAETRYIYFVATGDGGHRFSRTASEHAYWKRKFDQVRREVRLEERRKRRNSNGAPQ